MYFFCFCFVCFYMWRDECERRIGERGEGTVGGRGRRGEGGEERDIEWGREG